MNLPSLPSQPGDGPPWWRRAAPELAAAVGLLAIAGAVWRNQFVTNGHAGVGAPAWATAHDRLLYGPDAGAWASNAWALFLGRAHEVDAHRMPSWSFLVAGVMHLVPDVALAAHLTNHLLRLALPIVIYAVARALGGRTQAFVAGAVCAVLPALVEASWRSSVDPLVAIAQPLALLGGLMAARRAWLAPAGGVLVAVATLSHLTSLGSWGPALVLCFALAPAGWRRWAHTAALLACATAVAFAVVRVHPLLEKEMFLDALAEGVAPVAASPAGSNLRPDRGVAVARVLAGAPAALDEAMRALLEQVRPGWMNWYLATAAFWVGAFGIGWPLAPVEPVAPVPRRFAQLRRAWTSGTRALLHVMPGAAVLAGLTPLVAFAAAGSPDRYTANFLPIAVVLFVRGTGAAFLPLDGWLRRRLDDPSTWTGRLAGAPAAVLLLVIGAAWMRGVQDPQHPLTSRAPQGNEASARGLGDSLATHFPPGGGAAVMVREAAAYAGRTYCPWTLCPSPIAPTPDRCLTVIREQCSGSGDIPYVVATWKDNDDRGAPRKVLDAHIAATHTPVAQYADSRLDAQIYAIPRDGTAP